MPTASSDLVRWVTAKEVASATGVEVATVLRWCREGRVVSRRLPGTRGRLRIALDAQGFPVQAGAPTPGA
jgi:phage terminase Nu1 subunit (DNA packaging protein)